MQKLYFVSNETLFRLKDDSENTSSELKTCLKDLFNIIMCILSLQDFVKECLKDILFENYFKNITMLFNYDYTLLIIQNPKLLKS